jgi:hypothetical protein
MSIFKMRAKITNLQKNLPKLKFPAGTHVYIKFRRVTIDTKLYKTYHTFSALVAFAETFLINVT